MGSSRWLSGARADGGLLIPGRPQRHAADLLLAADRVELNGTGAHAVLAWSDHGEDWHLTAWAPWHRYGASAIAVALSTDLATATLDLRRSIAQLSDRIGRGRPAPAAVPLAPAVRRSGDLALVSALCCLLAGRPGARALLADRARVDRLADDLRHWAPTGPPGPAEGQVAQQQVVLDALGRLGRRHRIGGRPVAGDPLAAHEEIVTEVLALFSTDPSLGQVSAVWVDDVVRAAVTGVEPWPFGALTDGVDG